MIINKRLHFIWVGSKLPAHLADNIEAWSKLHPDWDLTIWGDKDLRKLRNQDLFDNAAKIVPRDAIGQFKADVARYELIERYGGFYADCDTRPLKSIESELENVTEFAAMEDQRWVGNTYLAGVANHRVFREVVEFLPKNIQHNKNRRPNIMTGPKMLTPIWLRNKCHVGPTAKWFPYSYTHVRTGKTPQKLGSDVVCVHQWEHTKTSVSFRKNFSKR